MHFHIVVQLTLTFHTLVSFSQDGGKFFDSMKYETEREVVTTSNHRVKFKDEVKFFDSTSGLRTNMSAICLKEKAEIRIMRVKTPWPCDTPDFYTMQFGDGITPDIPGEGMCHFERDDLLSEAKDAAAKEAIRANVGSSKLLWFFAVRKGTVKDESRIKFYGQLGNSPQQATDSCLEADAFEPNNFGNKRPRQT